MADKEFIRHCLEIRVFIYNILRQTFLQEPSMEFVQQVVLAVPWDKGFPFGAERAAIAAGAETVGLYLQRNDVTSEQVLEDLHWDYTRLFIGPEVLPAPPWESSYCSDERLLMQETVLQVRQQYEKYGFDCQSMYGETEDHLGFELDYMYQLARQAYEQFDGKPYLVPVVLRDSRYFLQTHLLPWVPRFAKDVMKHAETLFYQGMASLLAGCLELDELLLSELLEVGSDSERKRGAEA